MASHTFVKAHRRLLGAGGLVSRGADRALLVALFLSHSLTDWIEDGAVALWRRRRR